MKETTLITVVTVAYNAVAALRLTAQNVLAQNYPHLEYIIVDGGSSDGTVDYLQSLPQERVIWVSEPDNGIYDAMNKAIRMATGEYCIFMNAGDRFAATDTLIQVVRLMDGSDVVYGDITKNEKIKRAISPRNCHKMYYCHQAVFTRTTCLREYPFDTSHRFSADFKQAKLLFLAGKSFQQLPITVANFDTQGISNTQRSRGLWDNILVVREVDSLIERLRLLPRLFITWAVCRMRGK